MNVLQSDWLRGQKCQTVFKEVGSLTIKNGPTSKIYKKICQVIVQFVLFTKYFFSFWSFLCCHGKKKQLLIGAPINSIMRA